MLDTALYQYLLGLQSPWTVSRVNLDVNGPRMDVWAEHPDDAAGACAVGRAPVAMYTVVRTPGHRSLTLVCDLDEGTVERVAEAHTQESLDGYDAGLTTEQVFMK